MKERNQLQLSQMLEETEVSLEIVIDALTAAGHSFDLLVYTLNTPHSPIFRSLMVYKNGNCPLGDLSDKRQFPIRTPKPFYNCITNDSLKSICRFIGVDKC